LFIRKRRRLSAREAENDARNLENGKPYTMKIIEKTSAIPCGSQAIRKMSKMRFGSTLLIYKNWNSIIQLARIDAPCPKAPRLQRCLRTPELSELDGRVRTPGHEFCKQQCRRKKSSDVVEQSPAQPRQKMMTGAEKQLQKSEFVAQRAALAA
jgi:hypothetical protein